MERHSSILLRKSNFIFKAFKGAPLDVRNKMEGSYFMYDLESTGLQNYDKIGICEIAARELNTNKTYHKYVNPGRPIDPGATKVNGLTNEQLKDFPSWKVIGTDFLEWVRTFPAPYYLMAHNGYNYDHVVLFWEYNNCDMFTNFYNFNFIDSRILFRNLKCSFLNNYSLGSLYEEIFHKHIRNQHTAMADVDATITILKYIKNGKNWRHFFKNNIHHMGLQNHTHWKWRSSKQFFLNEIKK